MPSQQQQRLIHAKVSLALTQELRRRPTDDELHTVLRVVDHALTGLTITPSPPEETPTGSGGSLC